jgi:Ca2+-transporting ATPase
MDESALTGESAPVAKHSAVLAPPVPLAERRNMAFRGTAVSMGEGKGLVVGTGQRTEVGAIQALTTSTERPRTPMQRELEILGKRLVIVSSMMCVGIFVLGLLRGSKWLAILKTSMSLAIAAVPEGLPAAATTSLARGIRRMRDHDVLIRSLHAVENIGAIDTICLDKTGTLTQNSMSAVLVQTMSHALATDGPALTPDGAPGPARAALQQLLQVCVLCNETSASNHGPDGAAAGSSTENALLALARQAGVDESALRERYRLLGTRLRAEGRNHMRTVHAVPGTQECLISVKGSPDEVLGLCSGYLEEEKVVALDQAARARIMAQNETMAQRQLRVLGLASSQSACVPDDGDATGLTWLGMVGMADPLRPGAADVIARFHQAGIRTVMVTGDQATTAYEIGSALHLHNGADLNIVEAAQLEDTPADRLQALTEQAHIFARVSPSHKLQIVRLLQQSGKTIAMTGDGINDGPALRAADVGIAMGGGTDVALSVADVALKNDDLETLLEAVRQGRTISANIGKSLHFLVSSNLSEILVVLGGVALGSGQPLTPLQLLWLNLLSDLLPAIALAAEPAGDDVMHQPPRPHDRPIMGKQELWRCAGEGAWLAGGALGAFLYGLARHGRGPRAGTLAVNALVLGQLLHAILCRSDRHHAFVPNGLPHNRELTLSIGGSIALQVAANLVPGLRKLLGIAPMGPIDVLVTLAGALLPLMANELGKRRYDPGAGPA